MANIQATKGDRYRRSAGADGARLTPDPVRCARVQPIIEHLRPESLCLDLGCGEPDYLTEIARRCRRLVVVSPDAELLRQARETLAAECLENCTLVHSNFAEASIRLPTEIAHYDLIYSLGTLERLHKPSELVDLIHRWLGPRGTMIVGTTLFADDAGVSPGHLKEHTRDEVEAMLAPVFRRVGRRYAEVPSPPTGAASARFYLFIGKRKRRWWFWGRRHNPRPRPAPSVHPVKAAEAANAQAEAWAERAGRVLYKPHVAWCGDRSWFEPYQRYEPETRILDRRFTLIEFAKSVRTLPGSTAECGVLRGVGSALICKALEGTYHADACHFGFDSFEGLSEPVPGDLRIAAPADASISLRKVLERNWCKGDLATPIEIAEQTVEDFPQCRLIKGWIPDCFTPAAPHHFRLVHIDVDLQQPTWDSLAFFYPRMVPGGVLLFDDYGFLSCPGARAAIDQFFADKPEPVIELATGQGIVIKV